MYRYVIVSALPVSLRVSSLFQKFPSSRSLYIYLNMRKSTLFQPAPPHCFILSADNMSFKMTNTTFALAIALAVMLAAAADALPELTCNVTKTPDGFLHLLSRFSDCNTSWVDKNGVVLARNQVYDQNKVQSLTDQSLTSKLCHDNVDYTSTCVSSNADSSKDNRLTDERAHCTYTCSSPISDPKASQPTPVTPMANHNLTWQILLGVVSVVVSVAVFMAVILYIKCRKKKIPPSVVNYIEEQDVMVEMADVN